ncbi:GNAT family N-acetyltransferase [Rugosimonospora acidiphila]|uniref:GNAT family N-acetyltransferase n=1 Tax=Rugosimonospora acidiphila TaxID=556531 RepID=A0ABP9RMH1_9ACTN
MTLWRVRATVDDRPGYLSVLTASLALRSVNILSVQVHATEAGAVDDFLIDAPDALTEADLLAAVAKGRGRDAWVGRADVRGLVDTQTQLLGVATRLVAEQDELGVALAGLLGGATVSWHPQDCPAGRDFGEGLMRLPDPAGGTLLVRRDEPPFTPAEFARAHALVDLAGAVLRRATSRWQLLLPGGDELTVRRAGLQDAEAVAALYAECSRPSRHGGYPRTGRSAATALRRRLEAPDGMVLIAEAEPEGRVIGMAEIFRDGTEADVALLVAEAYRGRGVGGALLRRAARLAAGDGVEALHAYGRPDNLAMVRTMGRLGRPLHQVLDGPLLSVTADLRPDLGPGPSTEPNPALPGITG